MAPTEAPPRRRPMQQLPALIQPEAHTEIKRLAALHGRGVGEEYRAAVAAWIASHQDA